MQDTASLWAPSTEQLAMVELLVNPEDLRSLTEKCTEVGIAHSTLWRWMKKPEFVAYLNDAMARVTDAHTSKVWAALVRKAEDGDVPAMNLFFKAKGLLVDKVESKNKTELSGSVDVTGIGQLNDDELEKRIQERLARIGCPSEGEGTKGQDKKRRK